MRIWRVGEGRWLADLARECWLFDATGAIIERWSKSEYACTVEDGRFLVTTSDWYGNNIFVDMHGLVPEDDVAVHRLVETVIVDREASGG